MIGILAAKLLVETLLQLRITRMEGRMRMAQRIAPMSRSASG